MTAPRPRPPLGPRIWPPLRKGVKIRRAHDGSVRITGRPGRTGPVKAPQANPTHSAAEAEARRLEGIGSNVHDVDLMIAYKQLAAKVRREAGLPGAS